MHLPGSSADYCGEDNMDSPFYAEYLRDVALAARAALKIPVNQSFDLLHDGCTWHESKNGPSEAIRKNKIYTMQGPQKWPARSMDLNPIENLFGNCIQLNYGWDAKKSKIPKPGKNLAPF